MRRPVAYLAHPARLATIGAIGAMALTMLMLAGRPEAPPEAEAAGPSLTIVNMVVGADVSTSFTSTAPAPSDSFSLMNGEQHVITGVTNGLTMFTTEIVPAGYTLTDITCKLDSGAPLPRKAP